VNDEWQSSDHPLNLTTITNRLIRGLENLTFAPPVTHVYNPLIYARRPYEQYLKTYSLSSKEVVLVGMNPGPWGMAQTGIPFGEITAVKDWMGIDASVGKPASENPKRPITGFDCTRSEVSGRRLWGWAKETFGTPEAFFKRFLVINYCPLLFMEAEGRNRTPDKLPIAERTPLLAACDQALQDTLAIISPQFAVGIGAFAAQRVKAVAKNMNITLGQITHPSPANPRANRGWATFIKEEFRQMGIIV
jgi:single-strand selective monofunctional uracil DNA glycosylase